MTITHRQILAIALPAIVSNITTPLLGLVDMAIVGHMGSAGFIAAISLGGTIFSMIYWVFAFLRMGTSGITAQAVGADDNDARDAALYRALAVGLSLGLLLIVLQGPIGWLMISFMGSDESTSTIALQYFHILIYGAPATLGLCALNGWMVGVQNSRLAMYTSLIINVVNIVASLVLVYLFDMGIAGVAAGTLIAQWVGFVSGCLMIRRYNPKFVSLKQLLSGSSLKRFFSVNLDIFLRTLCLVAVTVWFTRASAQQGDMILAANALLMQFFILFSYMMDGVAYAGEALVGRCTGAGDNRACRRLVGQLFIDGIAITLVFTIIYATCGDYILSVLADNKDVLAVAADYRLWAIAIPIAGAGAFVWDGVYIGQTRTRQMLLSMALSMLLFFALYFLLFPVLHNHALWLAFISYLFLRGIILTLTWFHPVKP